MEGFIQNPEFELNNEKVPCYAIKLTPEQAKLVEHSEIDFLTIDGITMFKVKDKNGKETGEYTIFVIFKK